MHVYSNKFPERATELIQYNHIIQTVAVSYSWDNVYQYDKEFRRHMERHPSHSWGVILQQAWTMFLKDIIVHHSNATPSENFSGCHDPAKAGVACKLCIDFNAGHCSYSNKCKFEHKCGFCEKFGHGTFNCCRAALVGKKNKGSTQQQVAQGAPIEEQHSSKN